jgi:hypothetical protein
MISLKLSEFVENSKLLVKSDVELKEGKLSMEGFESLSNCGCIQILMGSEERAS